MSIHDVSNALRHVHNSVDTESQWARAKSGLANMTALEQAQVWTVLSTHTLAMDSQRGPVVFSQYKTLYKAALKRGSEECSCERIIAFLEEIQASLQPLHGSGSVVEINRVVDSEALLKDLKREFTAVLDTSMQRLTDSRGKIGLIGGQAELNLKMEELLESHTRRFEDFSKLLQKGMEEIKTVSETQNSILGLVEQHRKDLSTQDIEIDGLKGGIKNLDVLFRDLSASLNDINASIEEANSHITNSDAERKQITALLGTLADGFASKFQAIETKLTEVRPAIHPDFDGFKTVTTQNIAALKDDYAEIKAIFIDIKKTNIDDPNACLRRVQELDTKLEKINTELSAKTKTLRTDLDSVIHPLAKNPRPGQPGQPAAAKR